VTSQINTSDRGGERKIRLVMLSAEEVAFMAPIHRIKAIPISNSPI
jgi:hypothetical protein